MDITVLVGRFREYADDKAETYHWSNDLLVSLFAEAEEEACIRGRLIADERTIALSTPAAATLAATTGTLDDGTYSYRVSATNASGETLASTAATLAVVLGAGANGVTVTWTAVTGAVNYKIYGRSSGTELLMDTVDEATLTYTDDGSDTPSGDLPASNTTADVVKISVTEDRVYYPIHASIIEITKAYLTDSEGTDYVLLATDRKTLDEGNIDWRNDSERPTHYVHEDKNIRLNYAPTADETLWLEVIRRPLSVMSSYAATVSPEIDDLHHRHLIDWVLYKAYSMRNVDKYAPKRADEHYKRFVRYFGYSPDSDRRMDAEANRDHRVKSWW